MSPICTVKVFFYVPNNIYVHFENLKIPQLTLELNKALSAVAGLPFVLRPKPTLISISLIDEV